MIHPQAIIDPGAKLGNNVHIGPFTIVGPDTEIGDGTWVGPHVVLQGPLRIGKHNKIYQFSSLGEAPQHIGYKGEPTRLEIGNNNIIREYCTFNRGTVEGGGVTRLGNDNFIMAYCHLAHDCHVGNHTIFANCASLAGHVTVEDYAILGGFTLVHQFCRVGAHCITGIGAVAFKDVPPFVTATGNAAEPHGLNVRGLRRRRFSESSIEALRRAYKVLYRSNLTLNQAIDKLEEPSRLYPEVNQFLSFIKTSQRGIIR